VLAVRVRGPSDQRELCTSIECAPLVCSATISALLQKYVISKLTVVGNRMHMLPVEV